MTKGAKIGVVTDYLNRPLREIVAPETGTIMFIRAAVAQKGDTIATIGVIRSRIPEEVDMAGTGTYQAFS